MDCPNCGFYLNPILRSEHTLDDCVSNLQSTIKEILDHYEDFRVYQSHVDGYPKYNRHVYFEIDGDTHLGGYDTDKQLWFSDGEEWTYLDNVYWMYQLSPHSIYKDQENIFRHRKGK